MFSLNSFERSTCFNDTEFAVGVAFKSVHTF